jgi:hydroxymethylpyrimidine pyrophosphatase-like HAD family hydrolase/fructoselysine-6-P-deglycase FrlB-like protein
MTIFAEKLATLVETVRVNANGPIQLVADALGRSAGRTAVAIGSGGSAIMAEYFARCRATLSHGITIAQTPMDFVVSQDDMSGADIWIFSAGADNPDAVAAVDAALRSAASNVYLMTVNGNGAAAVAASSNHGQVFVVPVAERKDGFLATHSLMAMATCVLEAADVLAKGGGPSDAGGRLAIELKRITASASDVTVDLRPDDTVIVLHDPQCRTLATLIETSLWETAIAPVQRTDFRNFAHGRHVWAAKYPDRMLVIALTTATSRDIWAAIRAALPSSIRCLEADLGHAGRLRTAVSIAEGLEIVRALGERAGVDPGKPGTGTFAGRIYGDEGLAELAKKLNAAVRHKLEAVQLHDDPACPSKAATVACEQWMGSVTSARIGAILLDYDGTVVTTEDRFSPPKSELIAEMTRLARGGIALGFATGRGGSAGIALREALHRDLHGAVTVGYYNGGHIRPLDVDIEKDQPASDPDLQELAAWIETRSLLAPGVSLKRGRVQITIKHVDVIVPQTFAADIAAFPAIAAGRIRTVSSHHSFDLLPAATSKTRVTMRMRQTIGNDRHVLAIGDSGEPGGNDTEMLALPPSISVQSVCGHLEGSWSLFGRNSSGPAALLRILRALRLESGHARLDLDSLGTSAA